jgi:hypothetical protein
VFAHRGATCRAVLVMSAVVAALPMAASADVGPVPAERPVRVHPAQRLDELPRASSGSGTFRSGLRSDGSGREAVQRVRNARARQVACYGDQRDASRPRSARAAVFGSTCKCRLGPCDVARDGRAVHARVADHRQALRELDPSVLSRSRLSRMERGRESALGVARLHAGHSGPGLVEQPGAPAGDAQSFLARDRDRSRLCGGSPGCVRRARRADRRSGVRPADALTATPGVMNR